MMSSRKFLATSSVHTAIVQIQKHMPTFENNALHACYNNNVPDMRQIDSMSAQHAVEDLNCFIGVRWQYQDQEKPIIAFVRLTSATRVRGSASQHTSSSSGHSETDPRTYSSFVIENDRSALSPGSHTVIQLDPTLSCPILSI